MTPWLIVAGDFSPLGGMDAANHGLARYLAGRGDVHLVTHQAWPDLQALPSVRVHAVPRPFDRHLLGGALLAREGRRVWRRLAASGVRAVVNGGNCPIPVANWVHYLHAAHTPLAAGSPIRRAKTAWTHRRDLAAERSALRDAPLVICNSRRTRQDVIERIGVEPSRAHVVYYGCDPAALPPATPAARAAARASNGWPADRPLVGFVGALGDRRKAFDVVFGAWRALCGRADWDADLIVAGAGAELSAWRRRAAEAGLADRVRFLGFRRDVPSLLAGLDALVHPARYEAYGLSVREALCRGLPAIVSAAAGVAEHYPASLQDLLIVNPDDAGELADRLSAWRRDLSRYRALVEPLSAALRARTWDAMGEEIARLVEGQG